jgi:hypothetical protein
VLLLQRRGHARREDGEQLRQPPGAKHEEARRVARVGDPVECGQAALELRRRTLAKLSQLRRLGRARARARPW